MFLCGDRNFDYRLSSGGNWGTRQKSSPDSEALATFSRAQARIRIRDIVGDSDSMNHSAI